MVNHPSDDRQPGHAGVRAVDSVIAVWAEPLDRPVTWLALPALTGAAEVVVADPEGKPVSLRLEAVTPGPTLTPAGEGRWELRAAPQPPGQELVLELVAEVEGSPPARREVRLRAGP